MRSYIVGLLVKKDLQDLKKNMSILPVVIMAPFLAYFIGLIENGGNRMLSFWVLYGTVMVGLMIPAFTVAEEKEKGTLDSLLVSPATHHEIILAKVVFTTLLVLLVSFLTLAPNGGLVGNQVLVWLTILIGAAFFIQIGLIIGLFTKNQVAAGTWMSPSMLFFIMTPMFLQILPPFFRFFFEHLPNTAFLYIMDYAISGQLQGQLWIHFTSILCWNAVAYIFTLWGIRHQFQ